MIISDSKYPLDFSNDNKQNSSNINRELFNKLLEDNEPIEKKEDKTENLYKDLMSLLKTGFTEQELKDIEEILRKLEALNKDKSSGKSDSLTDIENRIKQLREHLKEAQEKATGRSARNLDTDTILNSEIKTYDSKENLNNIKDGSVLKENQLLVASAGEQLRLMEQLKQNKK